MPETYCTRCLSRFAGIDGLCFACRDVLKLAEWQHRLRSGTSPGLSPHAPEVRAWPWWVLALLGLAVVAVVAVVVAVGR